MVQRRRDEARRRLPQALGGPGATGRAAGSSTAAGKLRLKAGGPLRKLASIFANPDLPELDDYYEPWTYDYSSLISSGPSKHQPVARPDLARHRRPPRPASGARTGRTTSAGGPSQVQPRPEPARRRRGAGPGRVRVGLHDVPAAHLRALPEPGVRGLLPLGRDVQARGGRHRPRRPGEVPRLAHVRQRLPVQEGLLQLADRQGREVHALLPAHRGRHADDLLGDVRRAHPLPGHRPLRRRPRRGGRVDARTSRICSTRSSTCSSTRTTPRSARRRAATASPRTGSTPPCARRSGSSRWTGGSRCRCIPEYRTLPMVWYIPPLSPVMSLVEGVGRDGIRSRPGRRLPGDRRAADPGPVPGEHAHRRRRGRRPRRAQAPGGDAQPHAPGQPRRASPTARIAAQRRHERRPRSRTCTGSARSPSTTTAT